MSSKGTPGDFSIFLTEFERQRAKTVKRGAEPDEEAAGEQRPRRRAAKKSGKKAASRRTSGS